MSASEVTLYGRLNAVNVQKVLVALDELRVTYKRIDAGRGFGVNDTPEYLLKYPNGKVPMLTLGDFCLWESNAILRYLYAKFGSQAGRTAEVVASQDKWLDWSTSYLLIPMNKIFLGLIRTPPGERDEEGIKGAIKEVTPQWKIIDDHLQHHSYMDGDDFSMADIPIGCFLHRWLQVPIERPNFVHLERYYLKLKERESYIKWVAQELK